MRLTDVFVPTWPDCDPLLTGSRVIGTPNGSSPQMYFRLPDNKPVGFILLYYGNHRKHTCTIHKGFSFNWNLNICRKYTSALGQENRAYTFVDTIAQYPMARSIKLLVLIASKAPVSLFFFLRWMQWYFVQLKSFVIVSVVDYANITLDEVAEVKYLEISNINRILTTTALFIPYCNFSKPDQGWL